MPLLRLNLVLDTSALTDLKTALAESPKKFYAVVNDRILPIAQRQLDALLNALPGPVKYPFQFATPKSRRYYFANFNVPYKRTGAVRKWRIVLKAFTGLTVEMTFENSAPYAKYVYGDAKGSFQTPGHAHTGWLNASTVLPDNVEAVLNDLSEVWIEEAPYFDREARA